MKHKIALDEVIQVNGSRFRDEDRVKRWEFGAGVGFMRRPLKLRSRRSGCRIWLAWPLADLVRRAGLVKP